MSKSAFSVGGGSGGGGAGSISAVVYSISTTPTSLAGTGAWIDTGLSVTITPSSIANDILILAKFQKGTILVLSSSSTAYRILRNPATPISTNGAFNKGTEQGLSFGAPSAQTQYVAYEGVPIFAYDSPATLAAVTYKLQYIGSAVTMNDQGVSQMIAFEIER